MHRNHIIILFIIVIIILYLLNNRKENAGNVSATSLSNEAIQNISSVYANTTGTASFNNLVVTGAFTPAGWKGMIVMWSGSLTVVPTGWALCDGQNGTPDLTGKFIIGINPTDGKDASGNITKPSRKMGDTGGSENNTLIPSNIPKHSHKLIGIYNDGAPDGSYGWITNKDSNYPWMVDGGRKVNTQYLPSLDKKTPIEKYGGRGYLVDKCFVDIDKNTGTAFNDRKNCKLNPDGEDLFVTTSKIGGDATGVTVPHSIMPPFYALAYIIKL